MEIILSIVFLSIAGIFLIWLFSDEHCDKWEKKIIKEAMLERSKE